MKRRDRAKEEHQVAAAAGALTNALAKQLYHPLRYSDLTGLPKAAVEFGLEMLAQTPEMILEETSVPEAVLSGALKAGIPLGVETANQYADPKLLNLLFSNDGDSVGVSVLKDALLDMGVDKGVKSNDAQRPKELVQGSNEENTKDALAQQMSQLHRGASSNNKIDDFIMKENSWQRLFYDDEAVHRFVRDKRIAKRDQGFLYGTLRDQLEELQQSPRYRMSTPQQQEKMREEQRDDIMRKYEVFLLEQRGY